MKNQQAQTMKNLSMKKEPKHMTKINFENMNLKK